MHKWVSTTDRLDEPRFITKGKEADWHVDQVCEVQRNSRLSLRRVHWSIVKTTS